MKELFRTLGARRTAISFALALLAGAANSGVLATCLTAIREPRVATISLLVALVVIAAAIQMLSIRTLAEGGENMALEFRVRLLRSLPRMDMRSLDSLGEARLRQFVGRDAALLSLGVGSAPVIVMNVCLVIAVVAYLFVLDWAVGLLFVAGVVLGGSAIQRVDVRTMRLHMGANEASVKASELFSLQVRAAGPLKLNASRREGVGDETLQIWTVASQQRLLARTIGALMRGSASIVVFLLIATVLALRGPLGLSADELMTFGLLAIFFVGPVGQILTGVTSVAEARASFRRGQSLLATLELESPETVEEDQPPLETLSAHEMSFDYPEFRLGPLSLEIRRGEVVFIVGGNGSGKSTMVQILMGLLAPTDGQVLVNQQPVPYPNVAHRERFAFIPFDFVLLPELYGHRTEEAEPLIELLELADKTGLDGARWKDARLSQGQRRRLALIDALTEGKEVLVLDEFAADQDPVFRERFYRELVPLLRARGLTLLVVSHDDRYFDVADRVLKLDSGRIVSPGAAPDA